MTVALIPRQGGWHIDSKRPGHYLRVSGHPDVGLVVVSIWRGARCEMTHEIPVAEIPDLIAALARAALPASTNESSAAS